MLCDCCGEKEADPRCRTSVQNMCGECARPTGCDDCGNRFDSYDIEAWRAGDPLPPCAFCGKQDEVTEWLAEVSARIDAAVPQARKVWSGQSRSRYWSLGGFQIRVSDHKAVHWASPDGDELVASLVYGLATDARVQAAIQTLKKKAEDALGEAEARENPASPRFALLGSGSFAEAWVKDREVELIVFAEQDDDGDIWWIDACKEALLEARKRLAQDAEAQAYLPAITRKRLDKDAKEQPEAVYEMPLYEAGTEQLQAGQRLLAKKISGETDASKLLKGLAKKPEGAALAKALRVVCEEILKLAGKRKARLDLRSDNLASDENGHLILLDPVYTSMKWDTLVKNWQEAGRQTRSTKKQRLRGSSGA